MQLKDVLGQAFKVYGTVEEPLFLAKDVAEWIEHTHMTTMLKNVDEDEKLSEVLVHAGQKREMMFLTEDGVYEVLMQSRKPIAKAFKKEVKKILKEIRQNGGYIHANENDSDELIMARALLVAQKAIERKDAQLLEAQQVIEEQSPMVEKYKKYLESATHRYIQSI
ncbi:BRO-N domain-containing protein [Bacillus pseudomycoides]|uniref:BRO-N domain-containing protein n=1 Tax=Bacillus pseudomycoides TaxID=64104 RepID=UPI0020D1F6F2|nr:Bro-N domain-containing protein [Bacillus pseudomycoides]